jgi:hypothetical protein
MILMAGMGSGFMITWTSLIRIFRVPIISCSVCSSAVGHIVKRNKDQSLLLTGQSTLSEEQEKAKQKYHSRTKFFGVN